MNESDVDRRLRRWMADREPGQVPASLRVSAGRVPYETAVPTAQRVRDILIGPLSPGRVGGGVSRAAVALLLVGALVAAMVASLLFVGTARPRVQSLERWGAFVVDQPAPTIVMTALSGPAVLDDDMTVEFEDFLGSVVAVLVPAGRDQDAPAGDLAAFAEARQRTGDGVVFIVAARSPSVLDRFAGVGGAGPGVIDAVDLAAGGAMTAAFPDGADALVVVDRRGTVAAAFAGALPARDQLVELLHRLEVGR